MVDPGAGHRCRRHRPRRFCFATRRWGPVRTAIVEQNTIRSLVSTNGKIEPVNNFEAHAPVSTSVQRVLVKEGDCGKEGPTTARFG